MTMSHLSNIPLGVPVYRAIPSPFVPILLKLTDPIPVQLPLPLSIANFFKGEYHGQRIFHSHSRP
jgi:hypothetical protein